MTDATVPMPRRKARPHVKSFSEIIVEGALYLLGAALAVCAGALVFPLTVGILLSTFLPRKGLSAWVGPLLFSALAALLSTRFGLDTWEAQKEAFLSLLLSQKGWILENWPRYVTDGPLGVDFRGIPPLWAYFFVLGLPVGFLTRKIGLLGFFFPILTASSPSSSSVSPSTPTNTPLVGGNGGRKETTDSGMEDTPPYTVLRRLFTKSEAQRYTVLEAIRQARKGEIGYWLVKWGIFQRIPPHLLPCTHLFGGIDRVFSDFYTRLRACYRVPQPDSTHPTVYREPIQAPDTGQRASYRVSVPGNGAIHADAWAIGNHASYRVPGSDIGSLYTWGTVGQVGSVELLVSPPKHGKTKLLTGLVAAQRTGSSFLGWPTLQSGTVWLVEETPAMFDPKRREAMGHSLEEVSTSDRVDGQSMPKSQGYTTNTRLQVSDWLPYADVLANLRSRTVAYTRKTVGDPLLTCLKSGLSCTYTLRVAGGISFTGFPRSVVRRVSERTRTSVPDHTETGTTECSVPSRTAATTAKSETDSIRLPGNRSKATSDPAPALLAILYGPEVPRGLDNLAVHLAVACTVARVRSSLTGIPWLTIQVDSLFHWCPEAEQDASAAMAVLTLFKTVASLGFLVRVVVHADELTGKVKGPQNITRQCDFLAHLSCIPKTAKPRETTRRRLAFEGRFEDHPKPDDLSYELADNALKANLSGQSQGRQGRPARHAVAPTEWPQPDTTGRNDGLTDTDAGKAPQVGNPGTKAQQRMDALLAICPQYDQEPAPARPLVKAFAQEQGIQPDRVYVLAQRLKADGKLDITPIPGAKTHQWRKTKPT